MDGNDFPHEEYGILMGMVAPGTLSRHKSNNFRQSTTNNKYVDLIMADIMRDPRPSGIVLPRILRKKLLHQEREASW